MIDTLYNNNKLQHNEQEISSNGSNGSSINMIMLSLFLICLAFFITLYALAEKNKNSREKREHKEQSEKKILSGYTGKFNHTINSKKKKYQPNFQSELSSLFSKKWSVLYKANNNFLAHRDIKNIFDKYSNLSKQAKILLMNTALLVNKYPENKYTFRILLPMNLYAHNRSSTIKKLFTTRQFLIGENINPKTIDVGLNKTITPTQMVLIIIKHSKNFNVNYSLFKLRKPNAL